MDMDRLINEALEEASVTIDDSDMEVYKELMDDIRRESLDSALTTYITYQGVKGSEYQITDKEFNKLIKNYQKAKEDMKKFLAPIGKVFRVDTTGNYV